LRTFEFVAVGPDGATLRGREAAADEAGLDELLDRRGIVLVRAHVAREDGGHLSTAELIAFTSQLAVTAEAGVPLLDALDGFARRSRRHEARLVLERIAQALRAGAPLSEAMERESATFPLVYRASIRAGEASGSLGALLLRLVAHIEWQQEVRSTVRKALVYPAFLGVALLGLVVLMLTFLIPRVASMYPDGRDGLPLPTRIVMSVSDHVRSAAPWVAVALVAAVIAWFSLRKRARFQVTVHRALLRIPGIGVILHQVATARFSGVAATLQAAGCEIGQVIRIAADGCGNAALAASFRRVGDSILRGETLSKGLEAEPLADPLLVQVVAVGESAGDLDGCLARLATWYDQDVPRRVRRFLGVFEPALLLASAVVVGFLLLAALMPIFNLYDKLQ